LQLNQLNESLTLLDEVVRRAPSDLLARLLFGRLCLRLQEPLEAEKHFKRILKKLPTSESALSGLVDVAIALNQMDQAKILAKKILAINPRSEVGHLAAANVAEMQTDFEVAHQHYNTLIQLAPNNAQHRFHRSRSLLRRGELSEGWKEFEYRLVSGAVQLPPMQTPRWTGSQVDHLLLIAEQGLGDVIQFSRFISQAKPLTQRITLACQPTISELLKRSFEVETVSLNPSSWPHHDTHCALMSLPDVMGLGVASVTHAGRYLKPDSNRLNLWASRLNLDPQKLNVGVVYASSVAHTTEQYLHRKRSCSVEDLNPLNNLENTVFFNLQLGLIAQPYEGTTLGTPLQWRDFTSDIKDFDDTAAIIDLLDVLLCVDTAALHVAGALEKPAALLLPFSADWRWMEQSELTDWYKTVILFRQTSPGDWTGPMLRTREYFSTF
jgi:tetratricopeptide (TPR) repeat protein